MKHSSRSASVRRRIRRRGVPIDVTYYELVDDGSRGPRYEEVKTEQVAAYPDLGSATASIDDLFGAELPVDATFTVLRADIDEELLREGGGDGATRIEYKDRTFIVERVPDDGRQTLEIECSTPENG